MLPCIWVTVEAVDESRVLSCWLDSLKLCNGAGHGTGKSYHSAASLLLVLFMVQYITCADS